MLLIVSALTVAKLVLVAIFTVAFSAEGITAIVSVLIMALFAYCPGLRQWFAVQKSEVKSWIMLGTLLLAELTICILAVTNVIVTVPAFSIQEALTIAWILVVTNQSVYKILPQAGDVKALIAARDDAAAKVLGVDDRMNNAVG